MEEKELENTTSQNELKAKILSLIVLNNELKLKVNSFEAQNNSVSF